MNKNLTIGLAIIICAAVYGLYLLIPAITGTYNSYKDLNSSKEQIAQIKQQIADLESAKAAHVQKESAITKPIYKNDTPTSDSMSSFGVMFEDVIQAAKYNKLKLYSIAYNMAPAAKLSKYGNAGITSCAARIVSTAPIGSTTPESTPPRNAFPLLSPSALSGMDIIAPSGKF